MGNKAKIFSIIVGSLLVIPVLLNPPSSRKVLGVTDTAKASSTPVASSQSNSVVQSKTTSTQQKTPTPQTSSQTTTPTNTQTNSQSQTTQKNTSSNSATSASTPTEKKKSRFSFSLPKLSINLPKLNLPKSTPKINTNEVYSVRDITSGARDKAGNIFPTESKEDTRATGQIHWEENDVKSITTNKFELGKSIEINTANRNSIQAVVSQSRALPLNTILIVDQETFIELGGNPRTQQYINGEIILNQ